jgi:hypothetical protein
MPKASKQGKQIRGSGGGTTAIMAGARNVLHTCQNKGISANLSTKKTKKKTVWLTTTEGKILTVPNPLL